MYFIIKSYHMKTRLLLILLIAFPWVAGAQYLATEPRAWDKYPPEVRKSGFWLQQSLLVQMDGDDQLEEVFLFSADNGHYPFFDVFKIYYAIVGYYDKEVKYVSGIELSSERVLLLEDRNRDGIFELYRRYFKDGKFSVDKAGNNLSAEWVHDRIEWNQKDWK
ncbi:hypothetical protein FACS1894181_03200 [Bacteroidia bacterium]|nr:hypothetical protein FACS1894181_03200 [Bacteroidia bacterium]